LRAEMLSRKISLLKELDETIDFSKSTVQIEIMLAFLLSREKMTPSRLVELLDERRKAVLDALRKMQLKGVIKREGEEGGEPVYALTEAGEAYSRKLLEALGLGGEEGRERSTEEAISNRDRIAALKRIVGLYHIYNAVVYLANAPEGKMDLRRLSLLVGLSPERMKSYLDAYSRPPVRIFRRMASPLSRTTYYKLDREGWNIYYKSPHYMQLKSSRISRIRLKVRMRLWMMKHVREGVLAPLFFLKIAISYIAINVAEPLVAFAVFSLFSATELFISLFLP